MTEEHTASILRKEERKRGLEEDFINLDTRYIFGFLVFSLSSNIA